MFLKNGVLLKKIFNCLYRFAFAVIILNAGCSDASKNVNSLPQVSSILGAAVSPDELDEEKYSETLKNYLKLLKYDS